MGLEGEPHADDVGSVFGGGLSDVHGCFLGVGFIIGLWVYVLCGARSSSGQG